MEEAQKLAIGQRIKELRERSPYKQQAVADQLKIGLRAYQKLEEVGTTHYERCQELAEIFKADPRWIWDGTVQGATPDLMGELDTDRLAGVEATVIELRGGLADALELIAYLVQRQVEADAAASEADASGAEPAQHPPERVRKLGEVHQRVERLRRLADDG